MKCRGHFLGHLLRIYSAKNFRQSEPGYDGHNTSIIGRWFRDKTVALVSEILYKAILQFNWGSVFISAKRIASDILRKGSVCTPYDHDEF